MVIKMSESLHRSNVEFVLPSVAIVEKFGTAVAVVLEDTTVMIVSLSTEIFGKPFIPLVKEMGTKEEAHIKFFYLVGKMCSKKPDSKYFKESVLEEHLLNGNPNHDRNTYYEDLASRIVELCSGTFGYMRSSQQNTVYTV